MIFIVATWIAYVAYTQSQAKVPPVSQQEVVDTSIAQQTERPNSTNETRKTPTVASVPTVKKSPVETLEAGCALKFSFVPQAKTLQANADIPYAVAVVNKGRQTCTDVGFSLYYSDNEKFVSASPAPTASDYYWRIGDLGSNKRFDVSLVTHVGTIDGDRIENSACATGGNSDDVCTDNVIFTGAIVANNATNPISTLVQKIVNIKLFTNSTKEYGIWVWDSPLMMSDAYTNEVISVLHSQGFNTLYVTIDDYIPITTIADQQTKQQKKEAYFKTLAALIAKARSNGIAVDVVGGEKDWAFPENRWKGYALIDFVKEYNQAYPGAKIRGLQYDVEPYLLPEYDENKPGVLRQFLEFIDESSSRMVNVPASFSIVIPHFYDSIQKWTPSIEYNGKNAYVFTHLLSILQKKPGSMIIIMAYRNYFDGDNGVRQISDAEIDEATNGKYAAKVLLAQETGRVDPAYVTFYGKSKQDLKKSIDTVLATYGSSKNFGGVSVHYFEPFVKLK